MDLEGKWHEYKGKIREKWGKLTDDDLTEIRGKKEALLGKIQSRYEYTKEKAEKELSEFCGKHKSCGCKGPCNCGCGHKSCGCKGPCNCGSGHKPCGCKGPCNCGQKPRH